MPINDLISREAAIAVVEDLFDRHGELTTWTMLTEALAALPAAQKLEELQKDHNRLVDVICERNSEIREFEERIKLLDELARLDPSDVKE